MDTCEACMKGKQYRATYRTKPDRALPTEKGYCRSYLYSPPIASLGGHEHFLSITDIFSKFRKINFLEEKSDAADAT